MRKTLIISLNAFFLCLVALIPVSHSAQTESAGLAERRAQLAEAIDGFPDSAQELLRSVVLRDDFAGVFSTEQVHELSALMGLSANETALAAASSSYAPYSGNHAGVAIESAAGVIASGRYAENAAYNPSMSPLAAALVNYNFANQDLSRIKRAVLVQTNSDTASQKEATQAVLSVLAGSPELEVYSAEYP